MNRFPILVACASVLATCAAAKPSATTFALEEKIRHPVALPGEVLRLLQREDRVREAAAGARLAPEWFSAAEVDLDGSAPPELLVKAEEARLWGANQGPFWIFRRTTGGYRRILLAYGLSVEILPQRVRGWRLVRTQAASARKVFTHTYSFRNDRYSERR